MPRRPSCPVDLTTNDIDDNGELFFLNPFKLLLFYLSNFFFYSLNQKIKERRKIQTTQNPRTMRYAAPGFRYLKTLPLEPIKMEELSGNKSAPYITRLYQEQFGPLLA
jgi:hypothetical protein